MNAAWLYHLDSSACIDSWSCQKQEHTSVPPPCDARAADQPAGCELPKGHPGPHLYFADLEHCGAGDVSGTISGTVRRQHSAVLAS